MAKFTDLTSIAGANMTNSYVFAVSTSSDTRSLGLQELEKSFSSLTARTTNGISILGNTTPNGLTVGDNGFVGIDNTSPSYALHVGDLNGATHPELRITTASASRSASLTLADGDIFWKAIKKASDTDLYFQVSEDDSTYTTVLNIDANGNVGLFDGSSALSQKLYVDGDVKFVDGVGGFSFDNSETEIKTITAGDVFYINKSNTDDVVLGNNVLYVTNNSSSPAVGINSPSPSAPLEVVGANTILNIDNTSTSRSRVRLGNNASTAWLTIDSSKLNFGPVGVNSSNNVVYDLSSKFLGIGVTSPDNKLHIYSNTSDRIAKIESIYSNKTEVFHVNNFNYDGVSYTGPRNSVYTFGRSVGSSSPFTNNVSKWSIGLFDDGDGNTYEDVFVFRVDGDVSSNSSIKAYLDRDGDLDIQGSYTTNQDYAKGKFIQNYHSRCVSSDIYINPFFESSSTSSNSSDATDSSFGIAPFAGTIKKIKIISADTDLSDFTDGARFEISVVNASSGGTDQQLDCFTNVASSAPTSLPSNGVVAQFSLASVSSAGTVYSFDTFSGSATFLEGQLVQYRISQSDGSATDINCTIMTTISHTIV